MVLLIRILFRACAAIGAVFFLAGCATVHAPTVAPAGTSAGVPTKPALKKGIQHKVSKGETLWRIAKTYKVPVESIIQANGIPSTASIEENQLIFTPGADSVREVVVPSLTENSSDYAWPVMGKVVSYFQDHRGLAVNEGIDIRVADGDAVKAARDGSVVLADRLAGYGETVILDHGDGFFTVYAHNARLMVGLGDHVLRGGKVAQVGDLAYLHFEVRKGSKATNPLLYLP